MLLPTSIHRTLDGRRVVVPFLVAEEVIEFL
jgi:hypothetical protein